jgi:formylglycine-generating enzyme required for sulfatase activity
VDKYEASVWDIPPANTTLIQEVKDGTATLAELMAAGAVQVSLVPTCMPAFPATFPSDGHYSAPLYAVSLPGVKPTTCVTAYQAAVACHLSGKRLLTSTEWFAAGAGTNDANADNGSTDCATNAPGAGVGAPVNTGSRSACVSTSGTYDQIGNVYEWTLDRTTSVLTGLPSASTVIRGGAWLDSTPASLTYEFLFDPGYTNEGFGFRCGR